MVCSSASRNVQVEIASVGAAVVMGTTAGRAAYGGAEVVFDIAVPVNP